MGSARAGHVRSPSQVQPVFIKLPKNGGPFHRNFIALKRGVNEMSVEFSGSISGRNRLQFQNFLAQFPRQRLAVGARAREFGEAHGGADGALAQQVQHVRE